MSWKNYHLVTFGCSHTYGHGLKDCLSSDGRSPALEPSKLAWPKKLQEMIGFKTIDNKAIPGASNKMITREIVEYDYVEDTVVIILWANFNRHTVFKDRKEQLHMLPSFIKKDMPLAFWKNHSSNKDEFAYLVKTYYENYYEEYDMMFDQAVRMNFAHSFLKDKGIKSIHLVAEHELKDNYFKKFNSTDIIIKKFNWKKHFKIDDALDYPFPHPGPKSHEWFAYNINEWFFKK